MRASTATPSQGQDDIEVGAKRINPLRVAREALGAVETKRISEQVMAGITIC
ncbi:hypothetical protein [Enterobacter cancerogenus]|uniref:hypothetical protein n=1 Tax=Enterobacter cancerogenus TaxID=69218 RepID=UPI001299628D|nr:hypothetical protein [Enterobacter cancerogenus]QGG08000.1 hypothetical protein GH771_04435 [Enterobacter cancerogenus]QZY34969.1 hypothetical protein HU826_11345 [Enterobacter cancerogenus]HDR2624559.1 hypothetical protein [Enterobacter cancerogenus]